MRLFLAVALLALSTGSASAGSASAQEIQQLFQRASKSVVVVRTVGKALAPEPGRGLVSARGLGSGTPSSRQMDRC